MKSLTFVEIDFDYCSRLFGVGDCHASLTEVVVDNAYTRSLFNNSNDSWTNPGAGSLTPNVAGYSTLTVVGSNSYLQRAVSFEGEDFRYIMLDIECVTASPDWFGVVYYSTPGHSYSTSYRKLFGPAMVSGERTKFVLDMFSLSTGGNDWLNGDITGIQVYLGNGTGSYRIHEIRIGNSAFEPIGKKCFNTLKTCQSRLDFLNSPVTFRFGMNTEYLPKDIECIPALTSVQFSSATISMGENLGQRATVTATFREVLHSDVGPGLDKYSADRPYADATKQGSFWAKFRARVPYLQGRTFRLIRGLEGQSLAEMDTRRYIIESFNGPSADGTYTIVAKDILKLADNDRAQAPRMNNGAILTGIANNATSLVLTPTGVGNAEYPSSGYVALGGKEIVAFTRSGDTLTITRAQFGTVAVAHAAQDRVQLCIYYNAQSPAAIIQNLLINYANVPSSYIDIASWNLEIETYLARVYTALIAEPVGVNKLISELIEQAALAMWWDDQNQKIRLQVLRAVSNEATLVNPDNYAEGSYSVQEQPSKRLSQVWFYFGLINPLQPADRPDNYRSCSLNIAAQEESDYGSPAIKKVYSRWIAAFGRSVAERAGLIILNRYRQPPRKFLFDTWRYGPENLSLGVGLNIESTLLQDDEGFAERVPIQITRFEPGPAFHKAEAEEVRSSATLQEDANDRVIIIDTNSYNLNLRTIHDTLFPPLVGDTSSINIRCVINSGILVGATSASIPAFNVGSWPTMGEIKIEIKGRIAGAGGLGAQSGFDFSDTDGQAGGTALYTRVPIELEINELWGGGGGGGAIHREFFGDIIRINGGGGAGRLPAPNVQTAAYQGVDGPKPLATETVGQAGVYDRDGAFFAYSGAGGAPGAAGVASSSTGTSGSINQTIPGAAGRSIDGISHCTITIAGDRRGPGVN